MMGLGYLGNGVPSSSSTSTSTSTSNLSPLAPPFTVQRSNSKPFLNPTHYPPPPPVVPSTLDFFPNHDLVVDSIRTTTTTSFAPPTTNPWSLQNPNCQNTTASLGEPKPYYSPYVPSPIDNDTPLMSLNQPRYDLSTTSGFLSPKDDYTQTLSGLEYAPQWAGLWNELSVDGKQMDIIDGGSFRSRGVNVSASLAYKKYSSQGGGACEMDSTQGQGMFVDDFGRENLIRGQLQDRSYVAQNHVSIPIVESSKTPILRSGSMLSESLMEPVTVSWNHEKPFNNPYEKQFKLFDSAPHTKFSPVPLSIRPLVGATPPISAYSHTVNGDDIASPSSSKTKEDMPNKLHAKNASFCSGGYPTTFKARPASLVSDINITDGFLFTVESSEAVTKSIANSTESLDSPCWKGASPVAADISSFDAFEAVNPQQQFAIDKLETSSHGLNREGGIHIFPPYNESLKAASSHEVFGSSCQNDNTCLHSTDNGFSLPSEITWDTDLLTKEHYFKSNDQAPKTSSSGRIGVLSINNTMNPQNAYDVATNDSNCHTHSKPSETKQYGAEVDFLKSECATSTCEEAAMHQKENERKSPPQMDIHMLVNAIHNLSKLLLFHCSHHDGCGTLEKQQSEALRQATVNLDACMSMSKKKVGQMIPTQEESTTFPQIQKNTSCQLGVVSQSLHHMGASSRIFMEEIKAGGDCVELGHQFIAAEQKRTDSATGKKIDINSAEKITLSDDADVLSKDHRIIQDIKKILDQDFQCEEELKSDASGLFKNLWLEAEAELCIANYRTRFERVKKTTEVQKCNKKLSRAKDAPENTFVEEKPLSTSTKVSPDVPNISILEVTSASEVSTPEEANNIHLVQQKTSISSAAATKSNNMDHDNVEASVMARFQILKCRRDNNTSNTIKPTEEEQQLAAVWPTVIGIEENKSSIEVAPGLPHNSTSGKRVDNEEFGYRYGYDKSEKEFHICVTGDTVVVQPTYYSRNNNCQLSSSTWYDSNSSLDWEHVRKDDFALHK